jgi:hypothetical protein
MRGAEVAGIENPQGLRRHNACLAASTQLSASERLASSHPFPSIRLSATRATVLIGPHGSADSIFNPTKYREHSS